MNLDNKANRRNMNQILRGLKERLNLANGVIRIASEDGVKEIDKKDFIMASNEKIMKGFKVADRLEKPELAKLTALMSTGTSKAKDLATSSEL